MTNKQWKIFKRIIRYEWAYYLRKLQVFEGLVFLASVMGITIAGLNDTQSFFLGDNSPIPHTLEFLKNSQTVLIISVIILAIPSILFWILEQKAKAKDKKELLNTIHDNIIPCINLALESLLTNLKSQRRLRFKGNLRISLWIPVRKTPFNWNLQMVCKTNNIPDKELDASFKLDEGVIGYTYLKNVRKYSLEFVDLSNPDNLPQTYVALQPDNQLLINSNIKGILAIATLQDNSTTGLLTIDTDHMADFAKIQDNRLHDIAVDWIREYSGVVKLLWRMKNNL